MSKTIIKKEKEQKILNVYPNVYKDEIKNIVGNVKTGDIVEFLLKKSKLEEWNEKTFHGSIDGRIHRYCGCRIG